ncbi:MAG: phosphotransferase, partial [Pseudomonadota bacterium]
MSDRTSMISGFLHAAGWEAAARTLVAGDASNRRYERLTRTNGDTVILMDAPADKGEDVRPFIDVTHALRAVGLSAPDIRAKDEDAGLLLIEDLGDALFARVMEDDPALEKPLYEASVDVLLHLHREPPPDLPHYDAVIMTDRASLAFDWYQRGALGGIDIKAQTRFQKAMAGCLAPLQSVTP